MTAAGVLTRTHIRWVAPSPLWTDATGQVAAGDQTAMRRPALLRFSSDTFMDDLAAVLADKPAGLSTYVARPVSFRNRPPGAPTQGWPPPLPKLKLYQPLHGDFSLVIASLVCGLTGLPDHATRPADGERVGFVLRRTGATAGVEYGWASDPAQPGARRWRRVDGDPGELVSDEELLPMFPLSYPGGDRNRRLYAGLVPVSSRETYRAGSGIDPTPPPNGGAAEPDPRAYAFDGAVIGPLVDLRAPGQNAVTPAVRVEASTFLLLDFADLLKTHLPTVWAAVVSGTAPSGENAATLYTELRAIIDPTTGMTWRDGLLAAADQWAAITGEPGAGAVTLRCDLRNSTTAEPSTVDNDPLADRVRAKIIAALPPIATPPPVTPLDLAVSKLDPSGEAEYVVRCVYRRTRCAPARTAIVSEATVPFRIAAALDPDAPARTIRIAFPVDTNIKDLRKFRRGVGVVLSNQLRGQLDRIADLKKALDGNIAGEQKWELGVICQFSIPVITICALMILIAFVFVITGITICALMILIAFVFLLNIVFFWKSFFRICLPFPVRGRS